MRKLSFDVRGRLVWIMRHCYPFGTCFLQRQRPYCVGNYFWQSQQPVTAKINGLLSICVVAFVECEWALLLIMRIICTDSLRIHVPLLSDVNLSQWQQRQRRPFHVFTTNPLQFWTRKHSSRMRTARSSTVLGEVLSRGEGAGRCCPWQEATSQHLPPCGQTGRCKNITLPQTLFAGGNEYIFATPQKNWNSSTQN